MLSLWCNNRNCEFGRGVTRESRDIISAYIESYDISPHLRISFTEGDTYEVHSGLERLITGLHTFGDIEESIRLEANHETTGPWRKSVKESLGCSTLSC